jgi:PAS domain S-box-containing protein
MNKAVILIVDDQPANLFALEHVLRAKDRDILKAKDGEEALQIALHKNVDLIILDVQMPGIDGFEVAQILKSTKKTRDIPIIFATAVSKEHKFMMKGYGEGAVDFLYKPLAPDIVKAKVSVLLKLQLQKKELLEKNQALHKSALLINNSADAIGIVDSITLKIEEFNKAFKGILGYSTEEIRNTSLRLFLTTESRKLVDALAANGEKELFFETGMYCKSRQIKWLQWKVVVVNEKWFFNARDITEVKEVQKIRNYLATVVQQSNDAIYIYDNEEKIISWNEGAEKIYGYSQSEALNMSIWNIIPRNLQSEMGDKISTITEGRTIHDLETQRITKLGKVIDVLFSAAVIQEEDNNRRSIAITERDITERKKSELEIRMLNESLEKKVEEKTSELKQVNVNLEKRAAELQASNVELERFAFVASHDLQEPLRLVTSFLSLLNLEASEGLSTEAKEYIHFALQGSQRMKYLIEALLEYSRVGSQKLLLTEVDTTEVVNLVITDFELFIKESGAKINVHQLPVVTSVASQLRHVFQNLIGNALKYHDGKPPEIEVGCRDKGVCWEFYVKDNGIGFDPKYAEKIFIIFQRLHDKSEYSGTGIGLAICKKIIEKAGGSIRVESEPGKGSIFYFTVPKYVNNETINQQD